MEQDAFPKIGSKPITEITTPELLKVICAVEDRNAPDVACRILQRCSFCFRQANQAGRATAKPGRLLEIFRLLNMKNCIVIKIKGQPWWHDSNNRASGKPGPLHLWIAHFLWPSARFPDSMLISRNIWYKLVYTLL